MRPGIRIDSSNRGFCILTPGVVFSVDGIASGIDCQAAVVLEQVALDLVRITRSSASELDAISIQVVDEVVNDLEIGDFSTEVDTVAGCLSRAVDLHVDDANAAAVAGYIYAMCAVGGYAFGPAGALSLDGGVVSIDDEAGRVVLNDRAVLQQDGRVGLVDFYPA